jgi:transposase
MMGPTQREVPVVGIDVSKRHLDVCLLPEGESFVLSNDQEGIDELLGRLEGVRPE